MAGARGVEVYTRVTLYSFALAEPLFLLVTVAALSDAEQAPALPVAVALLVLTPAHMLLCAATVHVGLGREPFGSRSGRAVLASLLAVTAALCVLALTAVPSAESASQMWYLEDPRSSLVAVVGGFTLSALSPVLTMRGLTAGAVVTAAVVVLGRVLDGVGGVVGLAVVVLLAELGLVSSFRLTVWILYVVRELESSRDATARLAVAEERLRISRDMHDVVGRALSAVAVKSELAGALARRGDPRAADEMDEVRALAQESLREVRGVVAGYRSADLATELAGARSVLRAAGIATRVVGDVPALATPQAEALAWVVREAVTNVVRHSDARECLLRMSRAPGGVVELRITNDGVRPVPREGHAPGGGSGIPGLRERLAAVGGTLGTDHDGDRFTVTARVPGGPGPAGKDAAAAAGERQPYALRTAGEDA